MSDLPIELNGVADALACETGFWRSCTGCHETNEGVPTGPYSHIMKCHLGGGCFECGGIGAVWDRTDYADMGHFIAEEAPYDDRKLLDAIQHESWDLRCFNIPTGGDGCDIGWSVIGHWQAEPHERVVAEIYHDDPRAAIRAAIDKLKPISSNIDQRALSVADDIVRQMMDRGALLAVRNVDDELVPMALDRQSQLKAGWQTAIAAALKSSGAYPTRALEKETRE